MNTFANRSWLFDRDTYRRVAFAEAASVLGSDLRQRRLCNVGPLLSIIQLVDGLPVLGQVHVGLLLLRGWGAQTAHRETRTKAQSDPYGLP